MGNLPWRHETHVLPSTRVATKTHFMQQDEIPQREAKVKDNVPVHALFPPLNLPLQT